MKHHHASASVEDLVRRQARVSGLGDAEPPTLRAVDRRRFELWTVASFIVMALSVALVLPSLWPILPEPFTWLTPSIVRTIVLVLMAGLVSYVIEKAVALHSLRKLLSENGSRWKPCPPRWTSSPRCWPWGRP